MVAPKKVPEYVKVLIRDYLAYDRDVGGLVWRKSPDRNYRAGDPITDCVSISVGGVRLWYHRVVWFVVHGVFPEAGIKYKNGNRSDRRIENLALTSNGIAANVQITPINLERLKDTLRELRILAAYGIGVSDIYRKAAWSRKYPAEPIPDDDPPKGPKFRLWRLSDYE